MNTADLNRRIESIIRLGTIAEVDHAARKLRVKTGGLLTNWLAWPAEVGRNFRRWRPLRTGTQVVLACPSGDPAQAVIIQILYTQELDTPSDQPHIDLIEFNDGSAIQYDSINNSLSVRTMGNLDLNIGTAESGQSPARGDLNANVERNVKISVAGTVTLEYEHLYLKGPVTQTDGDMTSDGISAQHHKHDGVVPGPALTGEPTK